MLNWKDYCGLQLAVSNRAGEGKNIADVLDTGQIHDAALKAEAVACVATAAVFAEIQVEAVTLFIHMEFLYAREQFIVVIFTLAAADNFADAGDKAVHRGNRLAVGV